MYEHCRLCPRLCGTNRFSGNNGYCGESAELRLAFAGLHRGEEPPLSGGGGSGTVFVSGCNLGCALCQNWQISGRKNRLGRPVSTDEFAAICLALQKRGAENVNIVTGSHAVPAIVQGLAAAKTAGLAIPVLWNSSAYENVAALKLLAGSIDVFLPDLKTLDAGLSAKFFNAPDYPQAADRAIRWMIDESGKPVIIRHLILPGFLDSTRQVLRWVAENAIGRNAQLSLMSQYTPIPESGENGPKRFVSRKEYDTVIEWLEEFSIEEGFCQELHTGNEWLPDFTRINPFLSRISVPVWHYSLN
ncbi:MAG: radical SAM protein [Treponema sp.]|nr:radical SAM protein [Treponema sp.]